MAKPRTLFDKIWDDHLVDEQLDGTCLIYIDRHLVHEVTSPQAFEGLRLSGRKVRAPEKTLAVVDHNVPTTDRSKGIDDPESATQIDTLAENAKRFGRPASPPRTSSWPSSARSAPREAPATRSNMRAKRSARCRWKAA